MLKPLKAEKQEVHSVLDIETGKKGNLLAMSLFNDILKKPIHFYTWDELFIFLEENNEINYYHKLIAHNGGGFDWVHLFSWYFIESNMKKDEIEIILSGSSIIFGQFNQFKNSITFCDSLLVLKSSLDNLCEVFKPDVKKLKDFDIKNIEKIFKNNPDLFWLYLNNDVISLHQIINKFMALIEIDFFPLTVASLGLYKFRQQFLNEDIKMFKPNQLQDQFLTESYAGGRVECFRQGKFDQIYSYDINSLYPYIMSFADIPICNPIQVKDYSEKYIGFYRISFEQHDKSIPPILWKKSDQFGLIFTYKGEGIFSNHEIKLALKHGCSIDFHFGFIYPKTFKMFNGYVNYYYKLRLQYDKKHPMNLISKYLLNSLYGKFGQKETTEKLVSMTPDKYLKAVKEGKIITDYDTEKDLYSLEQTRLIPHRMVFIASIITSLARCELYKYIEKYKDDLIYCDTDSIHLTRKMNFNIGNDLGQMKIEESGRGIYIGRKMYGIFDTKKGEEKIRYKGLSTQSKLPHDDLKMLHLEKVLNQSLQDEQLKVKCHTYAFNTFPKLKSVLKGQGIAGQMKQVIKILKKPDYTTNFLKGEKEWI